MFAREFSSLRRHGSVTDGDAESRRGSARLLVQPFDPVPAAIPSEAQQTVGLMVGRAVSAWPSGGRLD
jgi:hypothetical protein